MEAVERFINVTSMNTLISSAASSAMAYATAFSEARFVRPPHKPCRKSRAPSQSTKAITALCFRNLFLDTSLCFFDTPRPLGGWAGVFIRLRNNQVFQSPLTENTLRAFEFDNCPSSSSCKWLTVQAERRLSTKHIP